MKNLFLPDQNFLAYKKFTVHKTNCIDLKLKYFFLWNGRIAELILPILQSINIEHTEKTENIVLLKMLTIVLSIIIYY